MVSLPGDSASSARLVTRPYTTAASAQTSATTTPWSVRNSDKETSLEATWKATKDGDRGQAAAERAGSLSGASTRSDAGCVASTGRGSRAGRSAARGPARPAWAARRPPRRAPRARSPPPARAPACAAAARGAAGVLRVDHLQARRACRAPGRAARRGAASSSGTSARAPSIAWRTCSQSGAGASPGGAPSAALRAARLSSVTVVWISTSSTVIRSISASSWRSCSSVSCGSSLIARAPRRTLTGSPARTRRTPRPGVAPASIRRALALRAVELGQHDVGARPGLEPVERLGRRVLLMRSHRPPRGRAAARRARGGSPATCSPRSAGRAGRAAPRPRRPPPPPAARSATISAARPSDSAAVICASQIRTSTVPKAWCGRTDHQSCVNSTIEPVRTSRSTYSAHARHEPKASGIPQRGNDLVKIWRARGVQARVAPVDVGRVGADRQQQRAGSAAAGRTRGPRGRRRGRRRGRARRTCCCATPRT